MLNLRLRQKKLLKINHSCLIVLPKVWLVHNNLKKGDLVNLVMMEDDSLVIKPCEEYVQSKT